MLSRESLDALAILSPAETHEEYLEQAVESGLHVLCEKPLLWGGTGLARRTESLLGRFCERRLLLWENCQWPYTLPAYHELHPGLPDESPKRFEMRLSPISSGVQMIGDAMPHALSMLQALVPGVAGRVDAPRFEADDSVLRARFGYRAGAAVTEVSVELIRSAESPRPAAYAIDGRWAHRRISLPGYEIRFRSGEREVPVRDPLEALIRAFVQELASQASSGPAPRNAAVADRMAMLEALVLAFEEAEP
jgi:predicted dehydrogenase